MPPPTRSREGQSLHFFTTSPNASGLNSITETYIISPSILIKSPRFAVYLSSCITTRHETTTCLVRCSLKTLVSGASIHQSLRVGVSSFFEPLACSKTNFVGTYLHARNTSPLLLIHRRWKGRSQEHDFFPSSPSPHRRSGGTNEMWLCAFILCSMIHILTISMANLSPQTPSSFVIPALEKDFKSCVLFVKFNLTLHSINSIVRIF